MFIIYNKSLLLLGVLLVSPPPLPPPVFVPIKCKLWFADTDHCTEQLGEDVAGVANR